MNSNSSQSSATSFFRNSEGDIAIWQWPNIPLLGWLVFKILSLFIKTESIKSGCVNLSMAFLFTWAYLEITSGASYFRRLLGITVMIALVIGYSK